MKVLAVIKKVGGKEHGREYVSQRGNHGYAYPVRISTEMGDAVFEAFVDSHERLAQRGLVEGAVGTIEVTCRDRQYQGKDGFPRFCNDLVVDGFSWQLANQNLPKEESAPAVPAPQEKTPEMEAAAAAKVEAAQNDPEAGKDLPF